MYTMNSIKKKQLSMLIEQGCFKGFISVHVIFLKFRVKDWLLNKLINDREQHTPVSILLLIAVLHTS